MIVLKATYEKLLAVLASVSGSIEKRHTLPVLANVLLRRTGSDFAARESMPAPVDLHAPIAEGACEVARMCKVSARNDRARRYRTRRRTVESRWRLVD